MIYLSFFFSHSVNECRGVMRSKQGSSPTAVCWRYCSTFVYVYYFACWRVMAGARVRVASFDDILSLGVVGTHTLRVKMLETPYVTLWTTIWHSFGAMYRNGEQLYRLDLLLQTTLKKRRFLAVHCTQRLTRMCSIPASETGLLVCQIHETVS